MSARQDDSVFDTIELEARARVWRTMLRNAANQSRIYLQDRDDIVATALLLWLGRVSRNPGLVKLGWTKTITKHLLVDGIRCWTRTTVTQEGVVKRAPASAKFKHLSLDVQIVGTKMLAHEVVADEKALRIDHTLIEEEMRSEKTERMETVMSHLDRNSRLVIELYLKGHAQKDIADRMGLTPSRVSQLFKLAVKRMKEKKHAPRKQVSAGRSQELGEKREAKRRRRRENLYQWKKLLGRLRGRYKVVAELYFQGWTQKQIGQKLGISHVRVSKLFSIARRVMREGEERVFAKNEAKKRLKQEKLEHLKGVVHSLEGRRKAVVELYIEGFTMREIGKKLKLSGPRICKILQALLKDS